MEIKQKIKKVLCKINFKIVFLIIIIMGVSISFSWFKENIEHVVNNNTQKMLDEINVEGISNISLKMDDTFNKLDAMSAFIGTYNNIQCVTVMNALKSQTTNDILTLSGVIKLDGSGITVDGENFQADYSDFYFEEALSGSRSISDVLYSDTLKKEYIILAVPISQDGQITGVLQCAYDIHVFTNLMGETSIGQKGTTFIAQNDGKLVSRPESIGKYTNLFDLLDKFSTDSKRISKLKKQIQNKETGIASLNTGKYKRYVCYASIPSTEWYAVSIVSESAVENVSTKIIHFAMILSVGITTIFTIYIIYWFVVDFLNSRKMHMKEQRYHIVANQTDSIVFEYNYKDKMAYHTHKWIEKFGYPPITDNYIENMVSQNVVYKNDCEKFTNIFVRLDEDNKEYVEEYIRINNSEKNPVPCKIRATAIRNRKNRIVRVVGKIIEIKDRDY